MPGASAQPVSAHYSLRQIGQGGAVTSQIHATVTIETPVEKVLEFVDDPENLANVHRWWSELWRWVGAGSAWVIRSESSTEYSGCPSMRNSELLDSSPRAGIHLTVDSRSGKRFMGP